MCFFVGAFWILHDFLGPKKSRSRRKRSASKRRTFQGPGVTCGDWSDDCWSSWDENLKLPYGPGWLVIHVVSGLRALGSLGSLQPSAIKRCQWDWKHPWKGFLSAWSDAVSQTPSEHLLRCYTWFGPRPLVGNADRWSDCCKFPTLGCSSSPTSGQHKPWNDGMPKRSAPRTLVITWNHEVKYMCVRQSMLLICGQCGHPKPMAAFGWWVQESISKWSPNGRFISLLIHVNPGLTNHGLLIRGYPSYSHN